jgi:hypothetical protein
MQTPDVWELYAFSFVLFFVFDENKNRHISSAATSGPPELCRFFLEYVYYIKETFSNILKFQKIDMTGDSDVF